MPGISIFQDVPLVPTDHVFAVNQRYNDDTHPKKVNLGVGGRFVFNSWNHFRSYEHRIVLDFNRVILASILSFFFLFYLAYKNDEGKPMVLPVVSKTEKQLAASIEDGILNHEYLPIDGLESFTKAACKLALGPDSPAIVESRVCICNLWS